ELLLLLAGAGRACACSGVLARGRSTLGGGVLRGSLGSRVLGAGGVLGPRLVGGLPGGIGGGVPGFGLRLLLRRLLAGRLGLRLLAALCLLLLGSCGGLRL